MRFGCESPRTVLSGVEQNRGHHWCVISTVASVFSKEGDPTDFSTKIRRIAFEYPIFVLIIYKICICSFGLL